MKKFKKAGDIKVGAIGYGGTFGMGAEHLRQMRQAGMTPLAVMDIDKSRLKDASRDFPGIETYSSVATMLRKSDVDLLTIITPHNTHARLAIRCLNAGRHVVCEKPLALTTAECDSMIAAAKRNNVLLSAYHNRHWDGCILQAMKHIRSGAVGEVFRVEAHMGGYQKPGDWWRSSKSISGGAMYDWGVHLLEYALQIIDSDIVEVAGFTKSGFWAPKTAWKRDTIEDEGVAIVRFASGARLTLCISNVNSNIKPGRVEVTGTKGSYIFDGRHWQLITPKGGRTVITKGRNAPDHVQWWRFYRNIADHLVNGEKLVITAQWARRPIHILDLAYRSAKAGRALKAKYK